MKYLIPRDRIRLGKRYKVFSKGYNRLLITLKQKINLLSLVHVYILVFYLIFIQPSKNPADKICVSVIGALRFNYMSF